MKIKILSFRARGLRFSTTHFLSDNNSKKTHYIHNFKITVLKPRYHKYWTYHYSFSAIGISGAIIVWKWKFYPQLEAIYASTFLSKTFLSL